MLKDLCFEVLQACPNNCKFCSSNSSKDKKTIISFDKFRATIEHFMKQGGIGEVSISGGEPFLHPQLFDMVEFCKENGIRTVIFTSGIKRSEDMPDEMKKYITEKCEKDLKEIEENEPWNERLKKNVRAYYERWLKPGEFTSITKGEMEKLKKLGLDKIVFDWQAVDEELDNELMGRKGLNTCLMDSIIRASSAGLDVDVHFIPMKPNYKEFPDMLECLEIAGVKNISILNFVPQGRGRENAQNLLLDKNELEEFSKILEEARQNYSGNIRIGIPLNGSMSHMCIAGTEKLDIKFDGTVLPCPAFKEMDAETLKKYGINLHNIYSDLEKISVSGGKRLTPLCKAIYGFDGNLVDDSLDNR